MGPQSPARSDVTQPRPHRGSPDVARLEASQSKPLTRSSPDSVRIDVPRSRNGLGSTKERADFPRTPMLKSPSKMRIPEAEFPRTPMPKSPSKPRTFEAN